MKTLLTAIALTLFATGTYAQAPQPYQKPDNFRLGDYGRFHRYLNQPVFCGIARCGDNWRRTNATPKPVKARRK
jgi:hypothetical protein